MAHFALLIIQAKVCSYHFASHPYTTHWVSFRYTQSFIHFRIIQSTRCIFYYARHCGALAALRCFAGTKSLLITSLCNAPHLHCLSITPFSRFTVQPAGAARKTIPFVPLSIVFRGEQIKKNKKYIKLFINCICAINITVSI